MFEVKTKYTFEEFKRYAHAAGKLIPTFSKKERTIRICICAAIIAAFEGYAIYKGLYILAVGWLAVMTAWMLYFFIWRRKVTVDRELRKVWDSFKTAHDAVQTYRFGEDSFTAKTPSSFSKVKYTDIYTLIENDTNFYVMLSQKQGLIINKEGCTPDQCEFIRSHCGINGISRKR